MTKERENELLRLVREIAEDEIKIAEADAEALRIYVSDTARERAKTTSKNLTLAVERKIELVRLLKEA